MKRLITTALAGLILAGSLSAPALAQQRREGPPPATYQDHDRGQQGDWRRDNSEWRDNDRGAKWDDHKYNGYWVGKSWHSGPPPARAYRSKGFQLGWRPWHKGDRLGAYHTHYVEVTDYRARRLPPPRRGYHYVQSDNGDILLAAVATGIIASIIASH
jgi:Ni/Co efflux regulator RcnB